MHLKGKVCDQWRSKESISGGICKYTEENHDMIYIVILNKVGHMHVFCVERKSSDGRHFIEALATNRAILITLT